MLTITNTSLKYEKLESKEEARGYYLISFTASYTSGLQFTGSIIMYAEGFENESLKQVKQGIINKI